MYTRRRMFNAFKQISMTVDNGFGLDPRTTCCNYRFFLPLLIDDNTTPILHARIAYYVRFALHYTIHRVLNVFLEHEIVENYAGW